MGNGWNTERMTAFYSLFQSATRFNQDLCSWTFDYPTLHAKHNDHAWVDYDSWLLDTQCPNKNPPSVNDMCYDCNDRRDRYLRFLPDSGNNNDERNNEREEEERRNEPKNRRDEEEKRRALQGEERNDIVPPSPFDIEVGVVKATDGPAADALQTAGGRTTNSPLEFVVVGTVVGLVGAVLFA